MWGSHTFNVWMDVSYRLLYIFTAESESEITVTIARHLVKLRARVWMVAPYLIHNSRLGHISHK